MYGGFNPSENAQYQSGSIKYYSPTELSRICRQNAESVSLRDSENYMKRMKHAETFEPDRHHRKHSQDKADVNETEERGRRKDKKEKRKHKKEYFEEMPTYEQYYIMTQQLQKDDKKDKKHKKRKNKDFSELNYQDLQCLINDYNRDMNVTSNYANDPRKYQRSRSIDQIPTRDITSDQKVKKSDRPKSVDRREDHHSKKAKDMHLKPFPPMPQEAIYQLNEERHQSKKHKGKSKKKKQNMADALDFVTIDQLNEQTMNIQEERFKHHKHGGKWYDEKNLPHVQQREMYGDYPHGKVDHFKTIQSFHQSMDDKVESTKNRKKEKRKEKMKEERRGESEKDYNTLKKYMKKMGKDPEKEGFYFTSKDDVDVIKLAQDERRGKKDKKHYKEPYPQYLEMEAKQEDYNVESKKKQKNRRKAFVPVDLGFEEQDIPPKHHKKHEHKGIHRPKTETKKRDSSERMRSMSLSMKEKRDHFEEYIQKRHIPLDDNEIGLKTKYRSESSLDSVSRRNKDLVYLYQNKDPPEQSEKCDNIKLIKKGESEKGRRIRLKDANTTSDKMGFEQSPYDRNQMVLPTEPKRDIADILNMQRKVETFDRPNRRDAETQPGPRLSRSRQRSRILRDEEEPTKEVYSFDIGVGTSTVTDVQYGDTLEVVKVEPLLRPRSADKKRPEHHVKNRASKDESLNVSGKDFYDSENTLGVVVKGVEPAKKVPECKYTSGFKFPSETPAVNRLECKILSVLAITPRQTEEKEEEIETPKRTKSTPQLQHIEPVVEAATSPPDRKTERLMKYYKVEPQSQPRAKPEVIKDSPEPQTEEKVTKNPEKSFKDMITSKLTDYLKKLQEDGNEALQFQTDDPGVVKLILPFECADVPIPEPTSTSLKEVPPPKPLKESFSDLYVNYSDKDETQEDNLTYSENFESDFRSQDKEVEYADQGNTANITDSISRNIHPSNVNYPNHPESESLASQTDNKQSCAPSSRILPSTDRNIVEAPVHFEKTEGYSSIPPKTMSALDQVPVVKPYQTKTYEAPLPIRSTFMDNAPIHPMINAYQNTYENTANTRPPVMDSATSQNMMNAYQSNAANFRPPHLDNAATQSMMNSFPTNAPNIRSTHMENGTSQDLMNAYPGNTYENQPPYRQPLIDNPYQNTQYDAYDLRPPPHMENINYNMNPYQNSFETRPPQMEEVPLPGMNYRSPYVDNYQTSPRGQGRVPSPQHRGQMGFRQYPDVPYAEPGHIMTPGGMMGNANVEAVEPLRIPDVGNWNEIPDSAYTQEYHNFDKKAAEYISAFEDAPRKVRQEPTYYEDDTAISRRPMDIPIESKYAKAQAKAVYQDDSRSNLQSAKPVQEDNDVSSRPDSPEIKQTVPPSRGNVTERSQIQKLPTRKKQDNLEKIPQILEKQPCDSGAKLVSKSSSIPKRVGKPPRQGVLENQEEGAQRADHEPFDRRKPEHADYENMILDNSLEAWDRRKPELSEADLHHVAPSIDKQDYSSSLEKCLHWNIRNSATVVMSEATDPAANKTPETEKSTEKSTVIPKKSHIPVAAKKERPSSSGKDRAGSAGGEIPCHMFLTKTYKVAPGQSSYERRKQYDTRIRKNVKKRSLSESSGPTKNLIYEVRYFNVINNCTLPISDFNSSLDLSSYGKHFRKNDLDKGSVDSLSTKPSCLLKKHKYAPKIERRHNRKNTFPRELCYKKKRRETMKLSSSKEDRIQDLINQNLLYSEYSEQSKKHTPRITQDRKKEKRNKNKNKDDAADNIDFKIESNINTRTKNKITVKCSRKLSWENARKTRTNNKMKHRKDSRCSIVKPEIKDDCQDSTNMSIDPTNDNEVSIFFENQKLSSGQILDTGEFDRKSYVSYCIEDSFSNEKESVIDTSYSKANTVIDCQILSSITTLESKDTIKAHESQDVIEHSIVDSGYMTKGAEVTCSLTTLASSINDSRPCESIFNEPQFLTPRFTHTNSKSSKWNEKDLMKLKNQLLFPDVYDDFELVDTAKNTELIKYYVESVNYKLKEAIDSISIKENSAMGTRSRSVISLPSVKMIPEEIAESGINGDVSSECSFRTNDGGFYNYQKFVAQNNARYSSAILSMATKPEASGDNRSDDVSDTETCSVKSNDSCLKRNGTFGRKKSLVELFKGRPTSAKKSNCSLVSNRENIVNERTSTPQVNAKMSDDDFFKNFHHIMSMECQKYAKKVRNRSMLNQGVQDNEDFEEIPLNCLLSNRNSTVEMDYEFELASDELDSNNNEEFPKLKGGIEEKSSESFKSLTCAEDNNEKLKTDFMAKRWQKTQRKKSTDSKIYLDFYPEEKTSIINMMKNANAVSDSLNCSPRNKLVEMMPSGDSTKQSEKQFFDNLLSFYDKEAEFVKKLIRDDEFFVSLIETIRNDEDSTTLLYHKDIQKKCRKEKKKGLLSRIFRWKEKKSNETLAECSSIDKSLEFAKSLSGGTVSLAKDSSYSIGKELEDLEKEITEKSPTKVANSEYLQQLAHKAKSHLEPMVQATMSNRHISDKIKLAGFLKLLDMVEKGDFTFLTVEDDTKSLEEKLREHVAKMFEKVYRIANREIQQQNSILDNGKIELLKILVTKYHMGVDTHINILAIYIGRGLIQTKQQLEDGILYLMGQDTQDVNLEQFEQNCGIQSG